LAGGCGSSGFCLTVPKGGVLKVALLEASTPLLHDHPHPHAHKHPPTHPNPTPPDSSVRISATATQDTALISVTDTGAGIAPERLAHIFKPFDEAAMSSGGTGLGLYLVKQCLDAMGCKISVVSAVGQVRGCVVLLRCREGWGVWFSWQGVLASGGQQQLWACGWDHGGIDKEVHTHETATSHQRQRRAPPSPLSSHWRMKMQSRRRVGTWTHWGPP